MPLDIFSWRYGVPDGHIYVMLNGWRLYVHFYFTICENIHWGLHTYNIMPRTTQYSYVTLEEAAMFDVVPAYFMGQDEMSFVFMICGCLRDVAKIWSIG